MAKVNGGALYCGDDGNVNVEHCLFESNRATSSIYSCKGGAIYSVNDVYVLNSTFISNYAYDYGGAIYADYVNINYNQETIPSNSFFKGNRADDDDGGAIYATSDVYARNAEFIKNSSLVDGGVIYAKNNVQVKHCLFDSNEANGAKSSRCFGGAMGAENDAKINNCI